MLLATPHGNRARWQRAIAERTVVPRAGVQKLELPNQMKGMMAFGCRALAGALRQTGEGGSRSGRTVLTALLSGLGHGIQAVYEPAS